MTGKEGNGLIFSYYADKKHNEKHHISPWSTTSSVTAGGQKYTIGVEKIGFKNEKVPIRQWVNGQGYVDTGKLRNSRSQVLAYRIYADDTLVFESAPLEYTNNILGINDFRDIISILKQIDNLF